MSGYLVSRVLLFTQAEVLAFAAIAVSLLGFIAAALSYLGHYATPERVRIRPWAPIPADLPDRPSHLRVMYGATDLKARYRSFMLAGTSESTLAHAILIGLFLAAAALDRPVAVDPGDRYIIQPELTDEPVTDQREGTPGVIWGEAVPLPAPPSPVISFPVPVPDAEARPMLPDFDKDALGPTGLGGGDIWNQQRGDGGDPGKSGRDVFLPPAPDQFDESYDGPVEILPVLVSIAEPVYPPLALQQQIEGNVRVRALVGTNGRVRDVRLVNSITILDDAAAAAARTGIFRPAYWQGQPVSVWVEFSIRFQLR